MKLNQDQMGGLFLLVFSITYGALIADIPTLQSNETLTARSMPIVLATLGILFGLGLVARTRTIQLSPFAGLNLRLGTGFLLLMSAYALFIRPAGFIPSTILFLLLGFRLLGEQKWQKNLLIASLVVTLFWVLMSQALSVYLPPWPANFYA